ncbi:MAG: hypothetical protein QXV17_14740 [Candidatus Micrarchaeaceae archaeon]
MPAGIGRIISKKYPKESEIAAESSAARKYVTRLHRGIDFYIHLTNQKARKIIFKCAKKTDKNDTINLAKLFTMSELPKSYLSSGDIDYIRSAIRYLRSLSEELIVLTNSVDELLACNGIKIDLSNIFGKRSLKKILDLSRDLPEGDGFILANLISSAVDLSNLYHFLSSFE